MPKKQFPYSVGGGVGSVTDGKRSTSAVEGRGPPLPRSLSPLLAMRLGCPPLESPPRGWIPYLVDPTSEEECLAAGGFSPRGGAVLP